MCEAPAATLSSLQKSKSTAVNILAVLSLTEINSQGNRDSSSATSDCQNKLSGDGLQSDQGQCTLVKGVNDQRYSFRGPAFSSLTCDWVVHHIWFRSRTLVPSSHPRLPDLKPPAGMRLISKVLSSLKDSKTWMCLCGALVISQELLLLLLVLCLALSQKADTHHTQTTNSPLRGACARISASRLHPIAQLIKSDSHLDTLKEKSVFPMLTFIIFPHYHSKACCFFFLN